MKDFSPVQGPIFTFFSAPFYKDLLLNGKGLGFIYLFLLLIVCWSLQTVKIYTVMQTFMGNKEVVEFVGQVPGMSWKSGKMSIDKPSPCTIDVPKGNPIILFDMSGKTADLEHANGAKALVTQDFVMYEKNTGVTETIPWSQMSTDFEFNQSMLKEFLPKLVVWCTGGYAVLGFFAWIVHIIFALLYGVAGLLMDAKKLGYVSMVRLAAFAMTPAIIISCIQFLVGFDIPAYGLVTIPMILGFMYFGSRSVASEES